MGVFRKMPLIYFATFRRNFGKNRPVLLVTLMWKLLAFLMGTIVDELAPCVRAALFLQQVDKSRRELLFSLPKRADVRKDMAQPASSG
jgi:hypothetical protein